MGPDLQNKDSHPAGILDREILVVIMQILSLLSEGSSSSQENKIVMECYLSSEPKIRDYRKCMLSLWLNKGKFWVSEQRLVYQKNTIHRNSWMSELEIKELERNLAENDS